MTTPEQLPQTVIGIPGPWRSRGDFLRAVIEKSSGYLFAGQILMHMESKASFTLEMEENNPDLAKAFSIAGRPWINDEILAEIDSHRHCLYLVGEGGTEEAARKFMHAADALLKCGGIAVKIESAGVAHSADRWQEMNADPGQFHLFRAFVTYVGSPGVFYSCGMHNLGYPDCVVEADIDPNEAAELIDTFLGYLIGEKPNLNSGETFSIDVDAPYYRLHHEPCEMFAPDDLFHNPFGVWKLVPAS